jgi:Protein of unknown function (DUF4242)
VVRCPSGRDARSHESEELMPRLLAERTFPGGLTIPVTAEGTKVCPSVIENNAEEHVTWVTSYVSLDRTKTFCIYDGPSHETILRAATANGLAVDAIAEVNVLDPYFYC